LHVIAVDDERMALKSTEKAIRAALPDCDLHCFERPSIAVAHAGKMKVDVAFLDIKMYDMDGLQLAKWLKEINPATNIIFSTAYTEYSLDSYKIPASAYLLKPITAEAVKDAMQKLRCPVSTDAKLRVQCFGNFDVYITGSSVPLSFPRSKAKELFAYLVHRRGGSCSVEELVTALFEEKEYDRSINRQIQTMVSVMRKVLREAGVEDVLIKQYNSIAVDTELIDCDYYRFLNQDPEALNTYRYTGEYMSNYSWAEPTSGLMTQMIT